MPDYTVDSKVYLKALQNKVNHLPSSEYLIPIESIPGNRIPSVCYQGSLLAYFRHVHEPNNSEFYTVLNVWSLATEQSVLSFRYHWKTLPSWALAPKVQAVDIDITENLLAFATSEK